MKNSVINLVQKLLKKNDISFDSEELNFQIQSHPSYPSLHAIIGVLDHFNIENIAAEVPVDQETLVQLPDCFIAQINTGKEQQELVNVERKEHEYLVLSTGNKEKKYTESEFLSLFTGIIIAVEGSEDEDAVENTRKTFPMVYTALGLLIVSLGFIVYQKEISLYNLLHLVFSLIGGVVSWAIIRQELGLQTVIGNAFCSNVDDTADCDFVLNSKGAQIGKRYKLSDLSLMYFSVLTLLTLVLTSPKLSYTISLFALPIALYSIYYQYKVVKKWCALCLSVVAILWTQAGISIFANSFIDEFVINDIIITIVVITSVWLIWNYIKPLVIENKSLRKDKIESNRFKRNFEVFNGLLQKSPELKTYIENDRGIVFGNPEADIEITLITNPFCGYCKSAHQQIQKILTTYESLVKVNVRFNVSIENKESDIVRIVETLLSNYNAQGEKVCLQAMDEIYEGMPPEKWLNKWENTADKETYIDELKKQYLWCTNNAINFTPEILINGKSYPKEYQKEDLIFFIEDLEEISVQEKDVTTITYYDDKLIFN